MDQPLDDPLPVLVEGLAGLEVEEADQVDEQEGGEEARAAPPPCAAPARPPAEPVEAYAKRNPSAIRSARKIEPATLHCTFAKVHAEDRGQEEEAGRGVLSRLS